MFRFTRLLNLARDALEFVFALGLHVNSPGGRSIYVYQFFSQSTSAAFSIFTRGMHHPFVLRNLGMRYSKNVAVRVRVPYVT